MKFEIRVFESDWQMSKKKITLNNFSNFINNYTSEINYGEDLKWIMLSIILIRMEEGYEEWYKPRRPKFIEHRVSENMMGEEIEVNKQFSIEIRPDNEGYDYFLNANDFESKQFLALTVLNSLSNLDTLPKKVKDFDKERFKLDINNLFKESSLL